MTGYRISKTIIVNTPDGEHEFNAAGLDFDHAMRSIQAFWSDWTSTVVVVLPKQDA